jgi:hypothetical protein
MPLRSNSSAEKQKQKDASQKISPFKIAKLTSTATSKQSAGPIPTR